MPVQEFHPEITDYSYVGDLHSLGSLQLTMLARGFDIVEQGQFDDLFPSTMINERTIVIEQIVEGLGIMPIVRFGVPGGGFVEDDRIQRRLITPVVVREEDFIEQSFINQLREPGTMNSQWSPQQIIERRIQKLVNRHRRTVDLFRAKILLGGVSYTDPRTNYSIDVSTQIPAHNFFSYKGFSADIAANALFHGYSANQAMTNDKGRPEAFLFRSTDERFGVPWTDDRADIAYTIRQLKQWLLNTNKNMVTEIIMHSDLLTILQENNLIKSYMGIPAALFMHNGSADFATANQQPPSSFVTLGPGGDLYSIGGLRIRVVNGLYRDPVDNQIKHWWPAHKVALVAAQHMNDPNAKLGMTQHCVGEAEDGSPGVYVRMSGSQEPPAPPGRVMQMGDAFLPFAIYPEWISILDVCEPDDIRANQILQSDLGFGTF
jgi:hypothetical protein